MVIACVHNRRGAGSMEIQDKVYENVYLVIRATQIRDKTRRVALNNRSVGDDGMDLQHRLVPSIPQNWACGLI